MGYIVARQCDGCRGYFCFIPTQNTKHAVSALKFPSSTWMPCTARRVTLLGKSKLFEMKGLSAAMAASIIGIMTCALQPTRRSNFPNSRAVRFGYQGRARSRCRYPEGVPLGLHQVTKMSAKWALRAQKSQIAAWLENKFTTNEDKWGRNGLARKLL